MALPFTFGSCGRSILRGTRRGKVAPMYPAGQRTSPNQPVHDQLGNPSRRAPGVFNVHRRLSENIGISFFEPDSAINSFGDDSLIPANGRPYI
ncbi:unnamed protein product [Periconia digitata]|uniref:Uncharacterized protein n=1 Tax=Periconia digitata TaxID=1303443 RepID=A0A9W4U8Q7_9PLEO|nr:unnamed protein product [Periconia digitata]